MNPRFGRCSPRNDETLLAATVDVLAGTLGLRDGQTGEHSDRVVLLAQRIGERLGLGGASCATSATRPVCTTSARWACRTPCCTSQGRCVDEERELIKGHSVWGADLVGRIPGLEAVARIVRHHHERYDGEGYPDGLAGRDIPLASRILTAADAYVAMTEDRPYRRARPRFEVDHEFRDCSGRQFDPYVVEALREVVSTPA